MAGHSGSTAVDDAVLIFWKKAGGESSSFPLSLSRYINILRRKTGAVSTPSDISLTDYPRRFHKIDNMSFEMPPSGKFNLDVYMLLAIYTVTCYFASSLLLKTLCRTRLPNFILSTYVGLCKLIPFKIYFYLLYTVFLLKSIISIIIKNIAVSSERDDSEK